MSERARGWLARGVLFVALLASLATSAPPDYVYEYETELAGPLLELDAERPVASVAVTVRALGLAPNGKPTTGGVYVTIAGRLAEAGAINVHWVRIGTQDAQLSALTEFSTAQELTFEGNCEEPTEGEPCEARFAVTFEREDGGRSGGVAIVDWNLEFSAQVSKGDEGGSEGPFEPPWAIAIEGP